MFTGDSRSLGPGLFARLRNRVVPETDSAALLYI
jgi:hypothetical protein